MYHRFHLIVVVLLFIFITASIRLSNALGNNSFPAASQQAEIESGETWRIRYEAVEEINIEIMEETSDGGVLLAGFKNETNPQTNETFVPLMMKIDSDGSIVWSKVLEQMGGLGFFNAIAEGQNGELIVGGIFYPENIGDGDGFLIMFDASGNIKWQKKFTQTDSIYSGVSVTDIETTNNGDFFVLIADGSYQGQLLKVTPGGEVHWLNSFGDSEAFSASKTMDGGLILNGFTREPFEPWIVRLDAQGSVLWERTVAVEGDKVYSLREVIETTDGNFIGVGWRSYDHNADVWVVMFDKDGGIVWERGFDSGRRDEAFSIAETSTGNFVLSAEVDNGYEPSLISLSKSGEIVWQKAYNISYIGLPFESHSDGGLILLSPTPNTGGFSILKVDENGLIPECDLTTDGVLFVQSGPSATLKEVTTTTITNTLSVTNLLFSVKDYAISSSLVCGSGQIDTDRDGLLNKWEIEGFDSNGDGTPDLDLKAMGADPYKPDIFVEVDWMEGHEPEDEAIRKIVKSFANAPVYDEAGNQVGTGINLHVDVGPDSIDWVTMKKWGSNGQGNKVGTFIETSYGNTAGLAQLSQIVKDDFLTEARGAVFHYSLWIHKFDMLDNKQGETIGYSAALQGNYPVFLVALGSMTNNKGSVSEQATVFMHELGHNLGLNHGGDQIGFDDDENELYNYKPNYLSVMNYSFSLTGLIIDGSDGCDECFDYSRFVLPTLQETNLIEDAGLGSSEAESYGTKYRRSFPWLCWPYDEQRAFLSVVQGSANASIDWSCNRDISSEPVQVDINGKGGSTQALTGYNDWANLDFNYAHRLIRSPLLTNSSRHLSSDGFDPTATILELPIEEARAIPGISEVRAQVAGLVSPEQVAPLETITYTVSAYTVDFGSIQSFSPTVSLPDGFTYVTNSTSGDFTANPTIVDNKLTWPSIEIPDNIAAREFSFKVQVGTNEGIFNMDLDGTSSTGFVISDEVEVRVQREPLKRLFLPVIVR